MNDEKANISYKLNKLIFCAGVIVFLFVNISLLIHFGDISYRGSTRFEFNKLILTLISVGLLATLTALAVFLRNLHLDERSKSLIIVAITGLHFFVLLIIGNELANEPGFNWDEGFIFADAQRLLDGTPLSNYFISVPHGVGTLAVDVIVIFLSRLLGYTEIIQIVRVFILANALAIEGTILCCTSVVKSICKRKEGFAEFLVPSMAYLFIPYYFYSLLLYSDTYSLFFSALTIKLYTDYCKHSKSQKDKRKYIYIYIYATTAVAFIGAKIKPTVFIILIAILIIELMRKNLKFVLAASATFAAMSVLFSALLYTIDDIVPTRETDTLYTFPYTMYLQYGAMGDYGDLVPEITTETIQSIENIGMEKTKEKQLREICDTVISRKIKDNLEYYAGKTNRLWGDGLYLVEGEVIHLSEYNDCFLKTAVYQNGIVRSVMFYMAQALQYVFSFLMLVGTIYLVRCGSKEQELAAVILALIGVTVFLVGFWEIRSRYLFNMTPLICVGSAAILDILAGRFERSRLK